MDSQLIIYVWDITFPWKYCNTVLAIGKVPAYIGEKKVHSECLGEWVWFFTVQAYSTVTNMLGVRSFLEK